MEHAVSMVKLYVWSQSDLGKEILGNALSSVVDLTSKNNK
jgi:hypothetical protein